jgi:hypothetical protein
MPAKTVVFVDAQGEQLSTPGNGLCIIAIVPGTVANLPGPGEVLLNVEQTVAADGLPNE